MIRRPLPYLPSIYERLDRDQPFWYPMSRSVPALFAKSTQYRRELERLPGGIAVTETSEDPGGRADPCSRA